jgi:hypothetical protein
MDLKEIGCTDESSGSGHGPVAGSCDTIINLGLPQSARNFLITRATICFSGGAVLHAVTQKEFSKQVTTATVVEAVGDTVSVGTTTHCTSF